jgi:hypothetical protein
LIDLVESLEKDSIDLALAKVRDPLRHRMRLSGAEEAIGADSFYASVSEGVQAYLQEQKEES